MLQETGARAAMSQQHRQRQEEGQSRVARHRRRLAAAGARRVEVTVPAEDAVLLREVAAALRAGGDTAQRVRNSLASLVRRKRATTGQELLEFFRNSPLVGVDLDLERDRSTGRPIDLE
jgi:hypothetical protein